MDALHSLNIEGKKEHLRQTLLSTCEQLHHEWKIMDTWITRDAYQDGTHQTYANNKLRNTWFTLVFSAVSQALKSGLLTDSAHGELRRAWQEVQDLWEKAQSDGFETFCQSVVPDLQTNLKEAGITISDDHARFIAVQLAKDPSGHLASLTVIGIAEALPFETREVEINAKHGIRQIQSPELATHLATFATTHDIAEARELLGNSESMVRAADSLLDLIRASLQSDAGAGQNVHVSP